MDWSTVTIEPERKVLRQFSAIWLVLFSGLAAQNHFLRARPLAGLVLLAIALAIGLSGIVSPRSVRWVYTGAMVLAFPIGWCVSNLLLALMYFVVVTPIGLLSRRGGKDELGLRGGTSRSTFWEPKPAPRDVSSYFRQY